MGSVPEQDSLLESSQINKFIGSPRKISLRPNAKTSVLHIISPEILPPK